MNPVRRALVTALAALVVGLGALLGLGPAASVAVSATSSARPAASGEQVVFTGQFVRRPQSEKVNQVTVLRYQVTVDQVFGPVDVPAQRVTVRTRVPLELCGRGQGQSGAGEAGQGSAGQAGAGQAGAGQDETGTATPTETPTGGAQQEQAPSAEEPVDRRPRLFVTTLNDAGEYLVASCAAAPLQSSLTPRQVQRLGEGRDPGTDETPETPLDDVGLLCPDTRDAIRLDDEGSCSALDDDTSFNRNAAPGLALVIVGGLGLLVVRQVGRPRPGR